MVIGKTKKTVKLKIFKIHRDKFYYELLHNMIISYLI